MSGVNCDRGGGGGGGQLSYLAMGFATIDPNVNCNYRGGGGAGGQLWGGQSSHLTCLTTPNKLAI